MASTEEAGSEGEGERGTPERARRRSIVGAARLPAHQLPRSSPESARILDAPLSRHRVGNAFSEGEKRCIHWALHGGSADEEVLRTEERGPLLRSSMQTLLPGGWLNAEIVNTALAGIQQRHPRSSTWVLSTFFLPSITNHGRGYDYSKVRRLSRRKRVDVLSLDLLLVPLHIGGTHWALAAAFVRERRIAYFDSMGAEQHRQHLSTVAKYIRDEAEDKQGRHVDTGDGGQGGWTWAAAPSPRQRNLCDCGMFMLCNAAALCERLPSTALPAADQWDYSQDCMAELRYRTVLDLVAMGQCERLERDVEDMGGLLERLSIDGAAAKRTRDADADADAEPCGAAQEAPAEAPEAAGAAP